MILDFGDDSAAPFVYSALEALVKRLSRENDKVTTPFGVVYVMWRRGRDMGRLTGNVFERLPERQNEIVAQWRHLVERTVVSEISPEPSDSLIVRNTFELLRKSRCLLDDEKGLLDRDELLYKQFSWAKVPYCIGMMHDAIKKNHRVDVLEHLYKQIASAESVSRLGFFSWFPNLIFLIFHIQAINWQQLSSDDFLHTIFTFLLTAFITMLCFQLQRE